MVEIAYRNSTRDQLAHVALLRRLNEEGLHATVDGLVESFAPWNAVRSFAIVDEHLLIELAGDLWANMPRTTVVEGSAAFDQLVQTLRSHGIAEKTR